MRTTGILIYILTFIITSSAQFGGSGTYDFLNINNSARIASLGGNVISIRDNDVNMAFNNPALLSDSMDMQMTLNVVPYVSDIMIGYVSIAKHYENIGTFAFGIHTIDYGSFDLYDAEDVNYGTFSAAEHALHLMYARELSPNLSIGATLKPVFSNLEQYNSIALVSDIGLVFTNKSKLFGVGITLRNYGYQLSNNYSDQTENIQPDLLVGFSQKLAHAPFRFSLTAHSLFDMDLTYDIENTENGSALSFGEEETISTGNKIMRHLSAGIEFVPSKSFYVAAGYNFRRRNELNLEEKLGTTGISWGFGIRIKQFHFAYGSARYHLGGSANHFSITTNLNNFIGN